MARKVSRRIFLRYLITGASAISIDSLLSACGQTQSKIPANYSSTTTIEPTLNSYSSAAINSNTTFDPSKLSGLVLWLELDAANSLYANGARTTLATEGGAVGGITDLSGRQNHATQSNSSLQPYMRVGNIQALSTSSLDMFTSRVLEFPSLFGASCTGLSVVIVMRNSSLLTSGTRLLWFSGNYTTGKYAAIYQSGVNWWLHINNGGVTNRSYNTGIALDLNPHIICLRWDNSTMSLDVDGMKYSNAAVEGAMDFTNWNNLSGLASGGTYVANYFCDGRYYAVLAYNRAIIDSELLKIQAYYGIKFSLPFGNYYKPSIALGVGTVGHCWQPQLVRLASGRLFCVFTEYSGAMEVTSSIVKSAYSDDDGATWSAGRDITGDGTDTRNNGALLLTSSGNLVCTYYHHAVGDNPSNVPCCKISNDGGATWGNEIYMGDLIGAGRYWVPYTNGVVLDDNTLLVPCFSNGTTGENLIFLAKSTNGGTTWTYIPIASGGGNSGGVPYNEHPIARKGNKIVCMVRKEVELKYYYTVSDDNGAIWSTPVQTNISVSGFPTMIYDGNILYFIDKGTTPYFMYSWDNGLTWKTSNVYLDLGNQYNTTHVVIAAGRHYIITDNAYTLRFGARAAGSWV